MSQRWKAVEREGAEIYGAKRISLSGGNNQQAGTRSDSTHPSLFIETKHGKAWLALGKLWKGTVALAKAEGKTPVLLIHPTRVGYLAVISAERHAALERVVTAAQALLDVDDGLLQAEEGEIIDKALRDAVKALEAST